MDRADDLRIVYLQRARRRVRELQIACQKGATSTEFVDIWPVEMRAFLTSFGLGPWSPNFCIQVSLKLNEIDKNLQLDAFPYRFVTEDEMAENPNEPCNAGDRFPIALFEDTQIRMCPQAFSTDTSASRLALILVHELFHHPAFGMEHLTMDVMNFSHCGAIESDSAETTNNPYCLQKFIGIIGAGIEPF